MVMNLTIELILIASMLTSCAIGSTNKYDLMPMPGNTSNAVFNNEIKTEKKFCPICQKEGKKSTVRQTGAYSTLAYCGNGFYDEDGNFHPPRDCNQTTFSYSCSNGHTWSE